MNDWLLWITLILCSAAVGVIVAHLLDSPS